MANVILRNVKKSFGNVDVIKGVDLQIGNGEFCVFVGPSGCGKSTLLRMIAGLEEITSGELQIGGRSMTNVEPADRGVAMVFQSYALYPHMTVRDNIGFGLRMTGHDRAEIEKRTARAADMLKLGPLLDRKPSQLSGGQRQRVAIGRAIVRKPEVFLFDEPLSNLDAELRVHMRIELAQLHKSLASTVIYVTHDQVEAMTLADKIVVMRDGLIAQAGSPLEVFDNPDNVFVAGFIGSPKINFAKAEVSKTAGKSVTVKLTEYGGAQIVFSAQSHQLAPGAKVTVGLRPQYFSSDGKLKFDLIVDLVEHLGGESFIYARNGGDLLTIAAQDARNVKAGQKFTAHFDPAKALLFDDAGLRVR